jgi:hypothetical protein
VYDGITDAEDQMTDAMEKDDDRRARLLEKYRKEGRSEEEVGHLQCEFCGYF